MSIYFTKIRDVKSPNRANDCDAGIDFFIPNDFKEIKLRCNESITIPLGIKVHLPRGVVFKASGKSGVFKKKGIEYGAGVIDVGYEGELSVPLIKLTNSIEDIVIYSDVTPNGEVDRYTILSPGEKIIQFIPFWLYNANNYELEYIDNNEYDKRCGSTRGTGGFGSSGVI